MWQAEAESSQEPEFKAKGNEIQKFSVIENLPQLLAEDAQSCITRVVPKIQQSLPTASTEFHMAASVIFKQILEERLVSHSTYTEVFLQSILSSLENREPAISHAWLETILEVIELLPVDIIKREILPIAVNEGQISQSVNSRIICCRLMGKIATRFDSASVKKEILPTVQALCQDVNNDVRACICLQLGYVAENIGDDVMQLLPYFVELASDEESNVKQAAIQAIGDLLPKLKSVTVKDVIIPLVKIACDNAVKSEDNVICVIAKEFGKLAQNSEPYLTPIDKTWFIKYFIQLAQIGTPTNMEESKQDFTFVPGSNAQINDRAVECRGNCAFNIPAMFIFAASTTEGVISLIPTFRNLANDSYYIVRRTIACSLHEITRVLGSKCGLIKNELIKLLRDDHEEVLQGLIPHIAEIFEHFLKNKLFGTEQTEPSAIELGKALMKCEVEMSSTNNWRLSALILNQFEILPKCFVTDFIYRFLVPIVTNRVLYSRPLPVRLAAGRTLLIFLRYSLKPQHKVEIRNKICTDFAHGSSCYMRMIFLRMMVEAMSIFSSVYFKEHFCSTVLSLMKDPVANVRLKAIELTLPIKTSLRLPADKKLLSNLETNIRNLTSIEKDRDVSTALNNALRQMDSIEVRVDSQPSPIKLGRYDSDDIKKYEEEKKLDAICTGKTSNNPNNVKKPNSLKMNPNDRSTTLGNDSPIRPNSKAKPQGNNEPPKPSPSRRPPLIRQNAIASGDTSVASTSNWANFTSNPHLTQPWETATSSTRNTNLSSTNLSYNSSNDYSLQKVQCSCYKLDDRLFRKQASSNLSEQTYHSDSCHCSCFNSSNYLKATDLFQTKHDYRFPDFPKHSLLTNHRNEKHNVWQDLMLTRSSFANKYKMPEFSEFKSHQNLYWAFSSMPEIPVPLVDDEFMVDAGIRIPSQLSSSQSSSKIPNLQDILYRNKKFSSIDRTDRYNAKSFIFDLPKRYSLDYEESSKSSSPSSSTNLLSNNHQSQYSSQSGMDDRMKTSGISSQNRTRFGFELSQSKSLEGKTTKDSGPIEEDRAKQMQPKNILERSKRHSLNYSMKLLDTRDFRLKSKRHNTEVRRLSNLDVNHNQGMSKIPVRNIHISGSRTAPVTRTCSPIRIPSELFEKVDKYSSSDIRLSRDRLARRFTSGDEELEKLCQKF